MTTYDNPTGTSPLPPLVGIPGISLPAEFALEAADRTLLPGPLVDKTVDKDIEPLTSPVRFPIRKVSRYGEAISRLVGAFSGPGFNLIFRPHTDKSMDTDPDLKLKFKLTIPEGGFMDDLLELNLTHELWTFPKLAGHLGDVPNRVATNTSDVFLHGIPYTQIVRDVTDASIDPGTRVPVDRLGKNADKNPEKQKLIADIHFEPGLFMHVDNSRPVSNQATICRMASIPHGTTINAQGVVSPKEDVFKKDDVKFDGKLRPGIPGFSSTASQPFKLNNSGPANDPKFFPFPGNQFNLKKKDATRLPQDLEPFIAKNSIESITEKMVQDPNELLRNHNVGKIFSQVITFTVATTPTQTLDKQACPHLAARTAMKSALEALGTTTENPAVQNAKKAIADAMRLCEEPTAIASQATDAAATAPAIGTTNIAQLDGNSAQNPNARTGKVTSTFWISTVVYTLNVTKKFDPKTDVAQIMDPEEKKNAPKDTVPSFVFPADKVVEVGRYQVEATQIQYSQTVNLIFNGLGWPHISVATLIPVRPVVVTFAKKLPN
ncbi:hypothetical protein E6O75_ATG10395 [Venturia nashicola]|uniref:Uncharacterized protein n=1 Tax=Venturia nashicola TaxID=86259 RepID=A0A4Z1NPL6_9PEZI|nr:hypothetical protein E6O75_ATG10395 [Venturia nashicola]